MHLPTRRWAGVLSLAMGQPRRGRNSNSPFFGAWYRPLHCAAAFSPSMSALPALFQGRDDNELKSWIMSTIVLIYEIGGASQRYPLLVERLVHPVQKLAQKAEFGLRKLVQHDVLGPGHDVEQLVQIGLARIGREQRVATAIGL